MLKEIARLSGMPAAKAHRYLVSFQRMGLVSQDLQSARYALGPFALSLGLSALASIDPVRLSSPILEELCDKIGMGIGLAVWGGSGATIVRYVETGDAISISLKVGRLLSLHDSATGRCFSTFDHSPAVQQVLSTELRQLASRDSLKISDLKQQQARLVEDTRRYGIAYAGGSHTPGINGLSAPVFDHTGRMVAAMTAVGSAGLFQANPQSKEATQVKEAAAQLSKLLGYENQQKTDQGTRASEAPSRKPASTK